MDSIKTIDEYLSNYQVATSNDVTLVYDTTNTWETSEKLKKRNYVKSIIFDAKTKKPIATQYNKIIIDINEIMDFVKTHKIVKIFKQPQYEGTHLIVYYLNDLWRISTRKCIDAHNSHWITSEESHYDMAKDFIDFNKLDKNYVYHYNLISYKNQYMADYTSIFGENYTILRPIFVTDKDTLKVNQEKTVEFKTVDRCEVKTDDIIKYCFELYDLVNSQNTEELSKGIIVELYDENDNLTLVNFQSDFYQYLYKEMGKNNGSTIYDIISWSVVNKKINDKVQEIYKKFINQDTVKFYKKYVEILTFIFKNLYFITRKPIYLYDNLPNNYKTTLYKINGIYLDKIKSDKTFRITDDHVRDYLFSLSATEIGELIFNINPVLQLTRNFNGKFNYSIF